MAAVPPPPPPLPYNPILVPPARHLPATTRMTADEQITAMMELYDEEYILDHHNTNHVGYYFAPGMAQGPVAIGTFVTNTVLTTIYRYPIPTEFDPTQGLEQAANYNKRFNARKAMMQFLGDQCRGLANAPGGNNATYQDLMDITLHYFCQAAFAEFPDILRNQFGGNPAVTSANDLSSVLSYLACQIHCGWSPQNVTKSLRELGGARRDNGDIIVLDHLKHWCFVVPLVAFVTRCLNPKGILDFNVVMDATINSEVARVKKKVADHGVYHVIGAAELAARAGGVSDGNRDCLQGCEYSIAHVLCLILPGFKNKVVQAKIKSQRTLDHIPVGYNQANTTGEKWHKALYRNLSQIVVNTIPNNAFARGGRR